MTGILHYDTERSKIIDKKNIEIKLLESKLSAATKRNKIGSKPKNPMAYRNPFYVGDYKDSGGQGMHISNIMVDNDLNSSMDSANWLNEMEMISQINLKMQSSNQN